MSCIGSQALRRRRFFLSLAMMMTLALGGIFFPKRRSRCPPGGVLISGFLQYFPARWRPRAPRRPARGFAAPKLDDDVRAFFSRRLGTGDTRLDGDAGGAVCRHHHPQRSCPPARFSALLLRRPSSISLPIGVIGIAIGTVLLPEMSRRITSGDIDGADGRRSGAPFDFTPAVLGAVLSRAFLTVPDVIMRGGVSRRGRVFEGRCRHRRRDARGPIAVGLISVRADPQRWSRPFTPARIPPRRSRRRCQASPSMSP